MSQFDGFVHENVSMINKLKINYINFSEKPESIMKEDKKFSTQPLVAKEHFVFTDPDGQLYHFSVEGNAIRDGTKVPAESSLGKK